MTTEQLNSLAREALLVEELAQRVVEKLLARMKQALVVYTGSNISAKEALEAMGRLRADGFTFRVLLSQSAANLLDVKEIQRVLEPEELWIHTPGETPEALTARYDTIIVPAATVRTAAHVAACMADTPAAAVILDGLMRGKDVILATDGCCGSHSTRTSAPAGALPAPPSSSEEGTKLVPVELPGALSPSGCPSGWLPEEALAEELAIELPKELPEELPEALSEELPGVLPGAWPSCAKASACAGSMARQIAAASTALSRRCFHRMC